MEKTITECVTNLKNKLTAMTDIDETTRAVIIQEIDERVAQHIRDWGETWVPFDDNGLLCMGMGWDECMVRCLNRCNLLTLSYDEVNALDEDAQENLLYNSPGAKLWDQFFTE